MQMGIKHTRKGNEQWKQDARYTVFNEFMDYLALKGILAN